MNEDLEEYIRYLRIERGLADNTIESYNRDLKQYLNYLAKEELEEWSSIDRYTILSFLQHLKELKKVFCYYHSNGVQFKKISSVLETRTAFFC